MAVENNLLMKSKDLNIMTSKALKAKLQRTATAKCICTVGAIQQSEVRQFICDLSNGALPTIFKARKELIESNIKSRQIEKEVSVNELLRQVRSYYYQIEYLQFNKTKLESLDNLYQDFIRIATVRYNAGDIKKIEISTAETQKGEINLLLKQNQVYLDNALQESENLY